MIFFSRADYAAILLGPGQEPESHFGEDIFKPGVPPGPPYKRTDFLLWLNAPNAARYILMFSRVPI